MGYNVKKMQDYRQSASYGIEHCYHPGAGLGLRACIGWDSFD